MLRRICEELVANAFKAADLRLPFFFADRTLILPSPHRRENALPRGKVRWRWPTQCGESFLRLQYLNDASRNPTFKTSRPCSPRGFSLRDSFSA
jgi:hypothetical protein